ncbi:Predicted nucleotidyltransferase [Salegentibacter echinorum]|uniref:Predicted nucleotidyltransferase n=1 Tax=Salegentibacter echinorum TaxID=1073325 RepID=A0A1M5KTD6_SALEC|nr:nucleotidyltransferase domain-containing protein [Salegentibacter echinorum]SHG55423.1 Predicted nucleotidyltransferase [Salegentibacter echinorum]
MIEKHGLSKNTVCKINSVFAEFFKVKKVVLYGSQAIGNYRPGSDIDLAIFSEEINFTELLDIERKLDGLDLVYTIDLLLFSKLDNEKLRQHILNFGKVFYKKSSSEVKI